MGRLAIAFALLLLLITLGADTRNLGPLDRFYDYRHADKIGHFLLYGGLTLLCCLALLRLQAARPPYKAVLTVGSVIAVIATLDELSQLWIDSRRADGFDLLAGYLGIAVFGALALWLHSLRPLLTQTKSRTDV